MIFEFSAPGNVSWSESIYDTGSTVAGLQADAIALRPLRLALSPPEVKLNAIRLSDDDVFRDSQYVIDPAFPYSGTYSSFVTLADPEQTVDVRLETAGPDAGSLSVHRRIFQLRGMPQKIFDGLQFVGETNWNAALDLWRNQIASTGLYGINTRDLINRAIVTSITTDGTVSTSQDPAIITLPKFVKISGIRGIAPPPNKEYQVLTVSTGGPAVWTYKIRGWNRPAFPLPTQIGVATAVSLVYDVRPIASAILDGSSNRKAGNPFGRRRGRRSKAR